MTTLDQIYARCTEDGDCLRWQGRRSCASGHPKIGNKSGRRVVYELLHGPIPDHKYVTVTCDCIDCLAPEHLALTTKAQAAKKGNQCPTVRLRKAIASAKANRKTGKLTMEKAREIRASSKTCDDLALAYGVDKTLISKVRTGAAWRELSASPFAGLGAR